MITIATFYYVSLPVSLCHKTELFSAKITSYPFLYLKYLD
jgi:hypothetical protein